MSANLKFAAFELELLDPLRGHKLSEEESFVASLLLSASSGQPVGIAHIIKVAELGGLTLSQRKVKSIVRSLRKDHCFPILARKANPPGYWWCANAHDMEAFIESFRKQALDELHTLSRIVKHNYPALQGQLRFDEAT